jgi:hypothetical protein
VVCKGISVNSSKFQDMNDVHQDADTFLGHLAAAPAVGMQSNASEAGASQLLMSKPCSTIWLVGSQPALLKVMLSADEVKLMIWLQEQLLVSCSLAVKDENGAWQQGFVPKLLTPEQTCSCSCLVFEAHQVLVDGPGKKYSKARIRKIAVLNACTSCNCTCPF